MRHIDIDELPAREAALANGYVREQLVQHLALSKLFREEIRGAPRR